MREKNPIAAAFADRRAVLAASTKVDPYTFASFVTNALHSGIDYRGTSKGEQIEALLAGGYGKKPVLAEKIVETVGEIPSRLYRGD